MKPLSTSWLKLPEHVITDGPPKEDNLGSPSLSCRAGHEYPPARTSQYAIRLRQSGGGMRQPRGGASPQQTGHFRVSGRSDSPAVVESHPELALEKVETALARLRYVGESLRAVNARFDYPRDPKDSKFIELAIAGGATHIVSGDNDLLCLASGHTDAAMRFRQRARHTRVVDAPTFLREMEPSKIK
jgi:predicted nucleic acid-binding protein